MSTLPITERAFAQQVVDLAHLHGWMVYRTWLSVRSPAGYPDLTLCRGERLLFAELKSDTGTLTPEQRAWLTALDGVPGVETYAWRPRNLDDAARVLA